MYLLSSDSTRVLIFSTTPVLLRTTKYYSTTTKYYSSTTKYYSPVPLRTTPVLLRTTKYCSSTTKVLVQYYFVLQSTSPVLLRSTKITPVLLQYLIISTYETSCTMRRATGLTIQYLTKYCACRAEDDSHT